MFSIIFFITKDVSDVISDGLIKTEFPADIAFISDMNVKFIGKFQGVIIKTTPLASYFI